MKAPMARFRLLSAGVMALALLLGVQARSDADNELAASASTFYIVAPGGDDSIAPMVHSLVDRFQALFDEAKGGTVWVVPRLSWNPNDLEDQCENDPGKGNPNGPQVLGGIILEGTNTYSSIDPFVVWNHGWSKVSTNAELVSCAPTGFPKPTITWVSNDLKGYGSRNGFPFETVAAAAVAATIHNSDTQALYLGTAIGGESGASTIPPVNGALTTHDASQRIANDLVSKLNEACNTSDPHIHQMCARLGLPRTALPNPKD
jgi:hypothetical protein